MKLSFIEIAGFRGFKDKAHFDLPGGFVVITGRNGVGKSTVLDAVDFLFTGTINKYSVKGTKGNGLDDHIWWVGEGTSENHYVAAGFIDQDGEEVVITRSRDRGIDTPLDEIARRFCLADSPSPTWPEALMRTTLIRDETIASLSMDLPGQGRFAAMRDAIGSLGGPDHIKRTSAIVEAATAARYAQDRRLVEAQAELGRSLSELTEARSVAERQADLAEAEQIVTSLAPNLHVSGGRADSLRRHIVDRKQSNAALAEALSHSEILKSEQLTLESQADLAEFSSAREEYNAAQVKKARADESLAAALRLEAIDRENDVFASRMMALLEHGETLGLQAGHCPLCDAVRSPDELAAAIEAARSRLSSRGEHSMQAAEAVRQAKILVEQSERALAVAKARIERLEARRNNLAQGIESLAAKLVRLNITSSPLEPDNLRRELLKQQEETARLEHALFVFEASSALGRVALFERRVEVLRAGVNEEAAKLTVARRTVETAKEINDAAREVPNQVLAEQFDTVLPLLKELYRRLRPHADWREIEIDFGGRVRASLNFTVGHGRNPQFMFSSGQRRAAGVAFLLAIHLSRPWCGLRALLLDDPVQHIDDYRALNLVEVLSAVRRTGRQVIVSVEDPALADLLCRRLRSTTLDYGRRFELSTAKNGSAIIERQLDVLPLPREILKVG
jgi:DNA repair exonuclease SbcCD ATPase subunit